MRILFVWPAAEFSIWDVGRGLRVALAAQGHDVRDYWFNRRLLIAQKGIGAFLPPGHDEQESVAFASELASDGVIANAVWHNADLVVVVSGLSLHPAVLVGLERIGIPVAVWLTESPYEDVAQAEWVNASPAALVFTHEKVSALERGWTYLPHAFDPAVHAPQPASALCDVLLVGTGWTDRQAFLEQVDWTGINLALRGPWPDMTDESPLKPFHVAECVNNLGVPALYAGAKICLNLHRRSDRAYSLNPRAYEIAACGAFQISDERGELQDVFGRGDGWTVVPTFRTPQELEAQIRFYLANPGERRLKAVAAQTMVQGHTFEARATAMIAAVETRRQAA